MYAVAIHTQCRNKGAARRESSKGRYLLLVLLGTKSKVLLSSDVGSEIPREVPDLLVIGKVRNK